MKENDMTDTALDNICVIANLLPKLEKLNIEGNLFYRVRKFRDLMNSFDTDRDRPKLRIYHENVHKYELLDQFK